MRDWTTAMDDVLTERHRHCTACGRQLGTGIRFSVWQTATAALACLLCARCRQVDPTGASIARVMRQRYGAEHDNEEEYA
jgi:hypothetical protein